MTHALLGRSILTNPALGRMLKGGPAATADEIREFHERLLEGYVEEMGGNALFRMKEWWSYARFTLKDPQKVWRVVRKVRKPDEYTAAVKCINRSGALLVRGPKWCGKTSTCQQVAKSSLMLRNPDVLAASADALEMQPSLLLRGDKPRLIDEWQVAPVLWDTVINAVDVAGGIPGQYILTGSATPLSLDHEDAPKHTGTGVLRAWKWTP